MVNWATIDFFNRDEFDSPDEPGSGDKMDPVFINMLDAIRLEYGKPLRITSGYRTLAHNKKVGGVRNSAHRRGRAVDIACPSSRERFHLIDLALKHGIVRVGIGKTFLHLDLDEKLAQEVCWLY